MNSSINLLAPSQLVKVKEVRIVRLLKLAAIISVCFVGLSSIAIFIILLQISPTSIKKEEIKVLASISAEKQKEGKIILINNKMQDIQDIIDKRADYEKLVETIMANIPEKSEISTLSISESKLSFTVQSKSVSSLNKLVDNFLGMAIKKNIIKNLTIDSITLDPKNGNYTISIAADKT